MYFSILTQHLPHPAHLYTPGGKSEALQTGDYEGTEDSLISDSNHRNLRGDPLWPSTLIMRGACRLEAAWSLSY